MTKIFETVSDGFYTAFFEPDPDSRRRKLDSWIEDSVPVIQSTVETELRGIVEGILQDTWEVKGWKPRAEKYSRPSFIDTYNFIFEMYIKARPSRNQDDVVDPVTPEVRSKTIEAAEAAKTFIAKLEPPKPIDLKEINLHDEGKYRVEVAIPLLEKFIFECYRDNVRKVRIIHGKGIGVLRQAVRDFLDKNEFVRSIASADRDHGGEGATEAILVDFSSDKLE